MFDAMRCDSATEFLEIAGPLLERDEVKNNLLLGIAASAATSSSALLIIVRERGEPVMAAVSTLPRRMIISEGPQGAADELARFLSQQGLEITRVDGPAAAVRAFAGSWTSTHRLKGQLARTDRLYSLNRVTPAPPAAGEMRYAAPEHLNLLARWTEEFAKDVGESGFGDFSESTRRAIESRSIYIWHDGEVVAMATARRSTAHGIAIGLVYTPPQYRRRGYATALVAQLSQKLLDSGRRWVCLFADAANRTTNDIYPRIGYQLVCEFEHVDFAPAKS